MQQVFVAQVFMPNGQERIGVFSTEALAGSWARLFSDRNGAVIAPFLVDDPEWGNRSVS